MILRPYKFVLVAVLQELDDSGSVTGERTTEQVVIYGSRFLEQWAATFDERVAELQAEQKE